jgi:hypothetical protein
MARIFLMVAAAGLMASACTMTPALKKERMTLAEANIEGMECRTANPPGSNRPQTICASPAMWEKYDREQEFNTDLTLDNIRNIPTSPFRRQ